MDDGKERQFPTSEITKLTYEIDVYDGVTKVTYESKT